MNDRDLYKLFNHVKTEENEFHHIEEEVSMVQKKRIKNNLNKKIKNKRNWKMIKSSSTVAAVAIACLVGVNVVTPTFAESIPVVGSIIQNLNEKMGIHGDYAQYSQIVNKSVTNKGITVTINEVMADQSRIMIGYTVKSDTKFEDKEFEDYFNIMSDFKINGKHILGNGSGLGNYTDDYTYVGSKIVNVSLLEIPEEFNIDLNISSIMDIKGKWKFAFSASKEEISKNSTIFQPDKQIDFPDSIVTVDKVEFSPIGTYISVSGDYKGELDESITGNILEYDYWLAYDDKGIELTSNGMGSGTSGDNNPKDFNSEMAYAKANHIPQYLTIIPLKIIPTGGGGVSFDGGIETPFEIETKQPTEVRKIIDGVYPKELAQGQFGKLIINDITTTGHTTIVNFTAQGMAPHFQAKSLHIKDDQGERIMMTNRDIRRNNENPNEFVAEFEALDSNKQYYLSTTEFDNVEFDEAMKFKIQLKE